MGDKKLSDKDKPGKIPGDAMQSREDNDESPNIEDEVVKRDPPAGAREPESMGEELDFTWECEGEDWYSYRTEDGWSEPLPASMLTVRCQLGILDSNTKLRSAVEGHDPAAVPAGVEGGLTVASLPGAEPADFMHTAAVTRTARKVSPAGGAAKAKKILAEIEKANGALKEWGNIARDLQTAGASLSKINQLMAATKLFAKVSVGLSLAGAALGIALTFIGGDPNEAVLKAIAQLRDELDSLRETMLTQFDRLKEEQRWNHARTQILGHVTVLDAIRNLLASHADAVKRQDENAIRDYERRLAEYGRDAVLTSVTGIFNQSVGKKPAIGIFDALYDHSSGDLIAMTDLATGLVSYCLTGLVADALIGRIKSKVDGLPEDRVETAAKTAEALYRPMITGLIQAQAVWHKLCVSQVSENVDKLLNADLLPRANAGNRNYKATADLLHRRLRKQWFWQDWLVIVYDPVRGFGRHRMTGWNYHTYFSRQVSGGKINVVVSWIPEGSSSGRVRFKLKPFDIPIDDKEAAKLLVPAVPYPGLQWLLAWHSSGDTFYAYSCTTRSQVYVGEVESEHYAHQPYTFYHMLVHH